MGKYFIIRSYGEVGAVYIPLRIVNGKLSILATETVGHLPEGGICVGSSPEVCKIDYFDGYNKDTVLDKMVHSERRFS